MKVGAPAHVKLTKAPVLGIACEHCGDEQLFELPTPLKEFIPQLVDFGIAHQGCQPGHASKEALARVAVRSAINSAKGEPSGNRCACCGTMDGGSWVFFTNAVICYRCEEAHCLPDEPGENCPGREGTPA